MCLLAYTYVSYSASTRRGSGGMYNPFFLFAFFLLFSLIQLLIGQRCSLNHIPRLQKLYSRRTIFTPHSLVLLSLLLHRFTFYFPFSHFLESFLLLLFSILFPHFSLPSFRPPPLCRPCAVGGGVFPIRLSSVRLLTAVKFRKSAN
jgi:ABC-type transport system involved in cytochrome c biogenesis permease subunit